MYSDAIAIMAIIFSGFIVAITIHKDARTRLNQQRIQNISLLLSDLTKIIKEGDEVREKISKIIKSSDDNGLKREKLNSCQDDIISFSFKLDRYCRIDFQIMYKVWAENNEIEMLDKIMRETKDLNTYLTNEPSEKSQGFHVELDNRIVNLIKITEKLSIELKNSVK